MGTITPTRRGGAGEEEELYICPRCVGLIRWRDNMKRQVDGYIIIPGISPDSQRDPRGQTGEGVQKVQGTQTQLSRHA